jgi:hypothetical protein
MILSRELESALSSLPPALTLSLGGHLARVRPLLQRISDEQVREWALEVRTRAEAILKEIDDTE